MRLHLLLERADRAGEQRVDLRELLGLDGAEIADLVAAQVPGASKRVVAETDQLVNVGKPDRFDRLALDFLAFAG